MNRPDYKKLIAVPFLLCAAILFVYLDYWKLLFMRPQGIHFMRQTDSLSFIAYYLKTGMHFFEPGIMNLESTDGKTASEFPLIYYIIAWLYRLFGEHEYFLKVFNTAIVFIGFYGVYRLLLNFLQDIKYALPVTFLLMGSTIIFYYTNNYLPDAAALGLTLLGLYLFSSLFSENPDRKKTISGLLLLILASLIKISFFIYPLACMLTVYVYQLFFSRVSFVNSFKLYFSESIIFLIGVIAVISWGMYVKYYNESNHGYYFLVRTRTIWDASVELRASTWKHITDWWADSYYPLFTKKLLCAIAIVGLLSLRKADKRWMLLSLFSFIGVTVFFLLFFTQFQQHDYYFLAFIPAIVIITTHSLICLKRSFRGLLQTATNIVLIYGCITGIVFAQQKMWKRYTDSKNDLHSIIGQQLDGADKILDAAGVSRDAKIIFLGDRTINGGTYFTNRFGWPVSDTTNTNKIEYLINKGGASYLLLTDSTYVNNTLIRQYATPCIIPTNSFILFRISSL